MYYGIVFPFSLHYSKVVLQYLLRKYLVLFFSTVQSADFDHISSAHFTDYLERMMKQKSSCHHSNSQLKSFLNPVTYDSKLSYLI